MGQFISLQEGIIMTTTYRQERGNLIANGSVAPDLLPICETLDKSQVLQLLNKIGCERLRIYLGIEQEKIKLLLVSVNSQDEDMLSMGNALASEAEEEENDILERNLRCPSDCPPDSPLNT